MSEINDRIAALEAQLAELKHEVTTPGIEVATSRRDMFKKIAIGAAGVAAGGALLKASPAAATNGAAPFLGQDGTAQNTSTVPTGINMTGVTTTGSAFLFQTGSTWPASGAAYPSALAGWASDSGGARNGIYGYTQFADTAGVVGYGAAAIAGTIGGRFRGNRAAINLVSNGAADALVPANVRKGDLVFTDEGDIWMGVANGAVVKLGGASDAGNLHLLPAPARAYDSRLGTAAPFGPLTAAASPRTVDLSTGTISTGTVDTVPAGATGALISVTLDATVGSGYLAVYQQGIDYPGNSNANWYTNGQILAVTTVSAVHDAKVDLKVGGGGSTQIVIDVIGYYF